MNWTTGGGWMLAGLRRRPGPIIGTLVAAVLTSVLTVAALAVFWAHSSPPLGRLAGADVVVAGPTTVTHTITTKTGDGKSQTETEKVPLPAYSGVPATLAAELARVPGVASATGLTGFPSGTERPGVVDLVAVKAGPGVSPDQLAGRIRTLLKGGAGYTIATGSARADLTDPAVAVDRAMGEDFSSAAFQILIGSALFALAGTTALSVNLRRGRFALLRAIGARRGQIRTAILLEQVLISLAGTVLGFLPGTLLGYAAVSVLADHRIVPAGSQASVNPQAIPIVAAILVTTCVISGLAAARRAARTSPARAVREVQSEPRFPAPVRLLLGLGAGAGVVALNIVTLNQKSQGGQLALLMPLLLLGMTSAALLGPVIVSLSAGLLRPLGRLGPSARLALAGARAMPRRTSSAIVPVAMAVGMIGAVGFSDTTIAHAAATQSAQAATADHVLQGPGLDDVAVARVRALPGVTAAIGVHPVQLAVADPHLRPAGAAVLSAGPVDRLLDVDVTQGSLAELKAGQIAVSTLEASQGVLSAHVGSKVTVHLPDGTPYRATVSAIYARSLVLGDALIPQASAEGHLGSPMFSQILVNGGSAQLAALAAKLPGVHLTDRQVANAQGEKVMDQNTFGDRLLLGVIAALAAATMINTLVVSTLERRRQVHVLSRIGAGRRQLRAMFAWQAAFIAVVGTALGAAVCAGVLVGVNRAITGSAVPYIPVAGAALVLSGIAVLTVAPIMGGFRALRRG